MPKKVEMLAEHDNGGGVIFGCGSVVEWGDADADTAIAEGRVKEVDYSTPSRINPAGYNGCIPPAQPLAEKPTKQARPRPDTPE